MFILQQQIFQKQQQLLLPWREQALILKTEWPSEAIKTFEVSPAQH